jgi:hypothetical protein
MVRESSTVGAGVADAGVVGASHFSSIRLTMGTHQAPFSATGTQAGALDTPDSTTPERAGGPTTA